MALLMEHCLMIVIIDNIVHQGWRMIVIEVGRVYRHNTAISANRVTYIGGGRRGRGIRKPVQLISENKNTVEGESQSQKYKILYNHS